MLVRLLWPFGDYDPGTFVDVDPKLGEHLVAGRFARAAQADEVIPDDDEPLPPTAREVMTYAREHGITTTEAKHRLVQPAPPTH